MSELRMFTRTRQRTAEQMQTTTPSPLLTSNSQPSAQQVFPGNLLAAASTLLSLLFLMALLFYFVNFPLRLPPWLKEFSVKPKRVMFDAQSKFRTYCRRSTRTLAYLPLSTIEIEDNNFADEHIVDSTGGGKLHGTDYRVRVGDLNSRSCGDDRLRDDEAQGLGIQLPVASFGSDRTLLASHRLLRNAISNDDVRLMRDKQSETTCSRIHCTYAIGAAKESLDKCLDKLGRIFQKEVGLQMYGMTGGQEQGLLFPVMDFERDSTHGVCVD